MKLEDLVGKTFELEIGADPFDTVPRTEGEVIEDCFKVVIESSVKSNLGGSLLKISGHTGWSDAFESKEERRPVPIVKTFKVKGKATLEVLEEVEIEDTDKVVMDDLKGKE